MRNGVIVRAICIVAALFYVGFGIWAFVAPESFFEQIATYPPYNEHLFHDLGAFELGLGAALVAALRFKDSLTAVLSGVAVGSILHAVAHWIDRELGGKSSDPWLISVLAVAVTVAAVARIRETAAE